MLQTSWAAALNPFINNGPNSSIILQNVVLKTGDNVINHLLGQKLQGWSIVRKRAAADIFDKQDTNQTPVLTLILHASTGVTVDIEVF